ncbi:hypothetical protein LTR35_009704 [Friedmanniomyces endolithicus]|nr:hypothetical protein LTR35_009704 [Friedmanniomyces endolithicus]KAK0301090.1 hypothetical protein LTS00_000239 [Friedmanniomyces endolithicus]
MAPECSLNSLTYRPHGKPCRRVTPCEQMPHLSIRQAQKSHAYSMATPRKSILAATLGRYATPADNAAMGVDSKQIMAEVRKFLADATEAGFDVEPLEINPQDLDDSLAWTKAQLQSKEWDGFVISFQIRSPATYTAVFETLVNTSREVAPSTKIMFVSNATDLMNTLSRNFST